MALALEISPATLASGDKPKSPNTKPYRKRALTQAVELQEEAYQAATNPAVPIEERAAFMRAWCDITETRRKLEMRPLPKPIDVSKGLHLRRAKASSGFIDPPAVQDKAAPTTDSVPTPKPEPGLSK